MHAPRALKMLFFSSSAPLILDRMALMNDAPLRVIRTFLLSSFVHLECDSRQYERRKHDRRIKKKCASKLFEHYECNGNEWQWHILYIYNAQLMHIAINPNTACASVRQRETENSNCVRKKIDTARDNARFRFMSMCCMLMQQQQQQREMCWRGCDVHQTKHKSIAVSECCCAHNFLITFRSFCVQHYYYYFIHFSGHDIDFWRRLRHRKHTQNIENIVVYLSGKASI